MKMLRSVFYLLLAANMILVAILLAPILGLHFMERAGEPERLNNQLNSDNIRVLPEGFASTSAGRPSEAAVVPPTPAADAAGAACVAYQGLNPDQAKAITTRAQGLGDAVKVREEGGTTSYWVNIPAQGGKQGAERRSAELKDIGVTDFFIVQESGATQYATSLGLYRSETSAKRQLDALQKKGVRSAVISVRENAGPAKRVELTASQDLLQRLGQDLADALKGVEQVACQPG